MVCLHEHSVCTRRVRLASDAGDYADASDCGGMCFRPSVPVTTEKWHTNGRRFEARVV